MVIQSVHFTFAPQDADKAAAMLRDLRDASRREEGIITFDVARGRDQTNVFALWEEYADSAAIDAHMATEHYQRLVVNGLKPLAQEQNKATAVPLAS